VFGANEHANILAGPAVCVAAEWILFVVVVAIMLTLALALALTFLVFSTQPANGGKGRR